MGVNASRSTNQERSLNRTKLISNFIDKNDNLDSLNITEFHNNVKVPLQMINTSSPNIVGGGGGGGVGGGVVKQNNAFNEQMIKHEIFNLLHDTEIQQYHYNNMKASGILNNDTDNHVITGGAVANEHVAANSDVSDVSDAMNRIKQVIMAELGTNNGHQQGGAVNSTDSASASASASNGCGCGSDGEKGYRHKCGSDNENGKKGKKGSKKVKNGKKGGKKGEGKGYKEGSSSSESSISSESSDSNDSNSEASLKNSGKGLSIFPFNSSDVQSSEKNYRLMRRKI